MRSFKIHFGVVATALVLASCGNGSYSLTNMASEPIVRATVTVGDHTKEFRNIAPGHSAPGCYTVRGDDEFVVDIELKSGRKLRKGVGYVTTGMFDMQHELVVTDSLIESIILN